MEINKQSTIVLFILGFFGIVIFGISSKIIEKKNFSKAKECEYQCVVTNKFDFRGYKFVIKIISSSQYTKNEKLVISNNDEEFLSIIQIGDTIRKEPNSLKYHIYNNDTTIKYNKYIYLLSLSSLPKDLDIR